MSFLSLSRVLLYWIVWAAIPVLAQAPVGVLSSSDAKVSGSASVVPRGLLLSSGTEVAAQKSPADLHLARGGQLRICPGTIMTASASQDGAELQISMGVGALEASYGLGPHGDTYFTPDLRITVSGPGDVDLQIAVDSKGNSCIDNRGVNAPYVVISQLLGDGLYRVQPTERVLAAGARVDRVQQTNMLCGCPIMLGEPEFGLPIQNTAGHGDVTAPLPQVRPGETQVEIDAPLIFDARALPTPTPSTGAEGEGAGAGFPLPSPTPAATPTATPQPAPTPESPASQEAGVKGLGNRIARGFRWFFSKLARK